eukprot:TRINITY_DN2026_c0_g1_i3.p1 TRINITY_DN2026_c0_g1~~TRINITY_DN2026_c0_g1_i3.p1  ORF type:complete len:366 (+),score=45.84 TRINITY_DN2026_c0_g1_i3:167-1264(+)
MSGSSGGKLLEEVVIVVGLLSVQVIYAAYGVLMGHLLSIGFSPLFLVIYGSLATFIFFSPFAFFFERNKWPKKFDPVLLLRLVSIAFGGVAAFQGLMLLGIKKTSPAIASAMPSLAPGFIFIIAWCLRFEKVDLKCTYSRAKIMGTLVCLGGAMSISFLNGPPVSPLSPSSGNLVLSNLSTEPINKDRLVGCMCLIGAVFILSCIMVLQAATLANFPAPLSICASTSLIGSLISGTMQLIQEHKLETGFPSMSFGSLIGLALAGGIVNGVCVAFHAWCVKKRGPVLVSMFNPVGTVCSAVLSALILGDSPTLGSMSGMILMFCGLYCVLWAKKKEDYMHLENDEILDIHDDRKPRIPDVEKPLLS